jgi:surface antigen/transposase-like protein
MGTIKQRLRAIKSFKIDIKRNNNERLLLAAVILFCLNWSLANPVKGVEQILLFYLNQNKSVIVEQTQNESRLPPGTSSAGGSYLIANSLASLNIQSDYLDNANQSSSIDEKESTLAVIQENALLAQTSPITFISQEPRTEIITYVVQQGDTPSSIAASFGITTNTLLWANKLKETSIIRPGDELIILPVSGVLHRVKNGQTIDWIAKHYKAKSEEIIAFNNLPADGSIQIGQKLVIPDGQMPAPARPKPTRIASRSYAGPGTGKSHHFPYGQCTWYVAQKRFVPWSGHAKSWLANARAAGYKTGTIPRRGAIIVTRDNWWYGHVGYVEAVNGNWVTFSEMNYLGWGVKSVRTLHVNDPKIRGYIY